VGPNHGTPGILLILVSRPADVGMYLRTTQRRNKDGSIVPLLRPCREGAPPREGLRRGEGGAQLRSRRPPRSGRARALERLVRSIHRMLDADGSVPATEVTGRERAIEIEASFHIRRRLRG
jgi:hypothetical protein